MTIDVLKMLMGLACFALCFGFGIATIIDIFRGMDE